MFGIRPSPTVIREMLLSFIFPRVFETAQPDLSRRDSSINGVFRTLSRIDRAFINFPTAEARDFHCYFHVFENLGKRSIPSDRAGVRVVVQQTDSSGAPGHAFRVGCPNISSSAQF